MSPKKKGFDAVKAMRETRDRLSEEFANMSYDEEKQRIAEKVGWPKRTKRKNKRTHVA